MTDKPRVLIVDDTPENIRLMMGILGKIYHLQAATSGLKAIEMAETAPQPDLILLDVVMPGMDGYTICQKLQDSEKTKHIPIIFVSGLDETSEQTKGLRLGAVDFISKPFRAELVRARVSNHLELKRHREALGPLLEARQQALRVSMELDVAGRLQKAMLPHSRFASRGCRLNSYLSPARAVGGDLFEHFFVDEHRLLFALGDVSDKGMAAALFLVQVRTLLRSVGRKALSSAHLLELLNEEIYADNQACMFVTFVCGLLHTATGELSLARGGHEHPLLFASGNRGEVLEFEGGPALGLRSGCHFPSYQTWLQPGQMLLFYTDGVTEAANPQGEIFGAERLAASLAFSGARSPEQAVEVLRSRLNEFVAGAEPADDITFLFLDWSPPHTPT
ncbi:MAG: fused response regulator/phosphatase [Candidatus Eremiobacteraeota bacterium]|nr:fused response regulator/phosphatase [Candidatus Eremiobacteraeota bacterium]MCW5871209.1 fused response regulator/phosphatase [Candidatus Eremiobacteraeota bacterium]